MVHNIGSRGTQIVLSARVNGIPIPLDIVHGFDKESDILTVETEPTANTDLTADGYVTKWTTPSMTTVTLTLAPVDNQWMLFCNLLRGQAGVGNTAVIPEWTLVVVHPNFTITYSQGTLIEGALHPNIGNEKLASLPLKFKFPTSGATGVLPI